MDGYTSSSVSMDAAVSLFNTAQAFTTVRHHTLFNNYEGVELGQANDPPSISEVGPNILIVRNSLADNPAGGVVHHASSGAVMNGWGSRDGPAPTDVGGTAVDTPYWHHPVGLGGDPRSTAKGSAAEAIDSAWRCHSISEGWAPPDSQRRGQLSTPTAPPLVP